VSVWDDLVGQPDAVETLRDVLDTAQWDDPRFRTRQTVT